MKTIISLLISFLACGSLLFSQVGINTDGSMPESSAMLDVKSTTHGVLIPRLSSASRNLVQSPATGLIIYNTTANRFDYFNGSHWDQVEVVYTSSSAGTLSVGGGVAINTSSTIVADNSAMLDVNDPSRGILVPRTTPGLIVSPAEGLLIYDSSTDLLTVYNGTRWVSLCASSTGIAGATCSQASVGVAIKTDNTNPHHSAILDVSATDRGVLFPRLSNDQRDALLPGTGLIIFNTKSGFFEFYTGSEWYRLKTTWIEAPEGGLSVPALTEITWGWSSVSDATGYKWNTVNDYATATDMGTATSHTETGLICGTGYTRYAWAYNDCGYSNPLSLNQTTLPCFSCGDSFVIVHEAGAVAPVDKTVTYGTVTGIPGEASKCWITSNLGADHQATSVNDATEASAGWYWQFNRKQGYKHDGTTRTPNTAWVSLIDENSDWDPGNDPCALELGNGWRLVTHSEWANVDTFGGWTNWNGPWGSGLKMHAAWYLYNESGNVYTRGSSGNYWSSDQNETYTGWGIFFRNISCTVDGSLKAYGSSVRCIKE